MNSNSTAEQKRFQKWCRGYGCVISGNRAAIHHISGAKMKLKGCKNPGEWYVLPLSYWWHQNGDNPAARHENKKAFERDNKSTEKELWINLIAIYEGCNGKKPLPEHEYQIIVARA